MAKPGQLSGKTLRGDFGLVFCAFSLLSVLSVARADDVTIVPVERWSNVFAESETRWSYRVSAERAFQEQATWRLTANQRTLASGEVEVRGDADKPAEFAIALRWPTLKEGVVLAAQLTVSVGDAQHERPVWIFARDPFVDRREWLQSLKLTVFDPPGELVKILTDSKIPHERVRSREALDEVSEGIVLIGEGVSLKQHESLIDDLRALVVRGVPVLCLASADGEFAFLGEQPMATALQLRRSDVIRELDKRLDAARWTKGSSQLRGLRVTGSDNGVVAEISEAASSWPWAEWTFAEQASDRPAPQLLWCGFGVVASWNDGPTPRYLFVKLLERLSTAQSSHSSPEN